MQTQTHQRTLPSATWIRQHITITVQRLTGSHPTCYKKREIDVKRKKYYFIKTVIECGKRSQNIFIGLKKTCLSVLDRGERGDNNGTGLKEGG